MGPFNEKGRLIVRAVTTTGFSKRGGGWLVTNAICRCRDARGPALVRRRQAPAEGMHPALTWRGLDWSKRGHQIFRGEHRSVLSVSFERNAFLEATLEHWTVAVFWNSKPNRRRR